MSKLSELADRVGESYARRADRHATATRRAKIAVVVLSAIIAAAQFWSVSGDAQSWTAVNVIGITTAIAVGALGIFLGAFEKDSADIIEDARKALVLAQESERDYRDALRALNGYDIDQTRSNELYNAVARMRDVVEAVLAKPSTPLETALQQLITQARRPLTIALGFQLAEHYTICIYVAENETTQEGLWQDVSLRCIAHARTIDCDLTAARKWPLGVGVAGTALARSTDVIVPNLKAIEIGTLYREDQFKEGDDDRYQSVAAVPILLDNDDPPWGVVVGTSDRAGHFVAGAGITTVEAIRAVAAMVALIVRVHRLGVTSRSRSERS